MAQPGLVKPKWFLSLMMMGIAFILIYFWYEIKSKPTHAKRTVDASVKNLWKENLTQQPQPLLPGSKKVEVAVRNLGIENMTQQLQPTASVLPLLRSTDLKNEKSAMNFPEWLRIEDWGLQKNVSLENVNVTCRGTDKEEITAWNNFFFGTTRGLVLELGAMNGKDYSVSAFFENQANWRTILIEGSPRLSTDFSNNRPNSLNFNAVICDKPSVVHYAETPGLNGIDGVVEFMSLQFILDWYPDFVGIDDKLDMKKVENSSGVRKVECLPLTQLFLPLKIYHINLFILDVEGGELNILKTIDFDKITFDVISVETDRNLRNDSPEIVRQYVNAVTELLASKGYNLWIRKLGRNSWFISRNFQPFRKSGNHTHDFEC